MAPGDEFVWENGRSTTSYSSNNNPKPEAGDTYPRKRPRPKLGSMLGLSGHQEVENNHEFCLFMETSRRDEYNVKPQIVPICEDENSRPNDELSLMQKCQVSGVFSRSIMDGKKSVLMGELADWNSQQSGGYPIVNESYKSESEAPVDSNYIKSKRIPVTASSSLQVNTFKNKLDRLPATSLCSASNDLRELASLSEDANEEEPVRATGKKKRTHNLSERKRRNKINKKMRALQALIPNSSMMDKASMLDKAIEYLKTLQLQLQIMSMGNSFYMPPIMIPTATQQNQIQAPGFGHLSPMMAMNPAPMFGLAAAAQMLPMTSHPQFLPFIGGSSTPSIFAQTPVTSAAPLFTTKQRSTAQS